jgi:hypothetical protein
MMAAATAAAPTMGMLTAEAPLVGEGVATDAEGLAAVPELAAPPDDVGLADDDWAPGPVGEPEAEGLAEGEPEGEPPAEGEPEGDCEAPPEGEGEPLAGPASLVGAPEAPATAPAESVPWAVWVMQALFEPPWTVMGDEYWTAPVPSRIWSETWVLGSRLTFQVIEVSWVLSASVMMGAAEVWPAGMTVLACQ